MSKVARTAGMAVTSFCALALLAAVPAQRAAGAPIGETLSDPLPPIPSITTQLDDGIARDLPKADTAEFVPVPSIRANVERPAASLIDLVARHESATAGDRDIDCLAHAVYFEAKSEPLNGQLAVAQVILNRAKSGRFAPTVCGVVKQPSQFSFVRNGGFPPIGNAGMWRRAVAIAQIATARLWSSPAEGAMYFHASRVAPNWGKQRLVTIGNHIFYR